MAQLGFHINYSFSIHNAILTVNSVDQTSRFTLLNGWPRALNIDLMRKNY